MNRTLPGRLARAGSVLSLSLLAFAYADVTTGAQDRLKTLPGYAQFQKVSTQLNGAMRSGAINGTWSADSSSVEYVLDGKRYRFDVATRSAAEIGAVADAAGAAAVVDAAAGEVARASSAAARRRRRRPPTAS